MGFSPTTRFATNMEPYLSFRLRDAIYDNRKFIREIRIILSRALRREEGHDRYGKGHTAMDNSKGITVSSHTHGDTVTRFGTQ